MLTHNRQTTDSIGALIEVGSGSVLVGVVVSNPKEQHPKLIWSKREFAPLRDGGSFEDNQKALMTTLLNAAMTLDSEGRTALKAYRSDAEFTLLQVSVSAPWSCTVSKVMSYDRDTAFIITDDLLTELSKKANEGTMAILKDNAEKSAHNLSVMTRAITKVTANGYTTQKPIGKTATQVTLTQISAIADTNLVIQIADLHAKCFPTLPLERYSTMLIFHAIVHELYPDMREYCLIDVTYEATEIAIVRDGVLGYSTYRSVGINTLVRSIASQLQRPTTDTATLLKYFGTDNDTATEAEKKVIIETLTTYQNTLGEAFHETGDSLAIPKLLFLHGTYEYEQLLDDYIIKAAHATTLGTHAIHTVTKDIIDEHYNTQERNQIFETTTDTGALMSSQFFHKPTNRKQFTSE